MRLTYLLVLALLQRFVGATSLSKRSLDDVFGGLGPEPAAPPQPAEQHAEHTVAVQHITHGDGASSTLALGALLTSLEPSTKTSSKGTVSHSQTTLSPSPTSYSIIGSIPPLPSYTPWSSNAHASSSTPSPTPSPTSSSAAQSTSHATESWKIIGVAVIAFTTVAAILLLSVFFDHWWGFIRDLLWKKKRKDNFEEFVPDWEKADWGINASTAEHSRYPSFAGPRRREKVANAWNEKSNWGLGINTADATAERTPYLETDRLSPPHSTNPGFTTNFSTPLPPPPALQTPLRGRVELNPADRRKSRVVSTAYSDMDPYAGIA